MNLLTEMKDGCVHSGGCCIDTEAASQLTVARLEHDAAWAHALIQEIAVLRDASESMDSTHGRLVLKLLDLLDDRAERLMREWGFDSGEVE